MKASHEKENGNMAVFYPSLEEIRQDTMEKHTAGELSLLEELEKLPDCFNIYFQAHINFAHPDVIIESAGRGILIIEVKDWDLHSYTYYPSMNPKHDKFGYLMVNNSSAKLSTPFEQVQCYKDEMFEVLSPELYAERLNREWTLPGGSKRSPVYGVVKTAVFFSTATKSLLEKKFGSERFSAVKEQLCYDKYTACWTAEDRGFLADKIENYLEPHRYYSKFLHESVIALFSPSVEWLEQTKPIPLSDEQNRFAQCTPGHRTRILGTPGSGKTLIIAQKAINCYLAKKEPVLILTFNITLKNYIRDKIAVNSRDMSQRMRSQAFEILHLDQFLPQMLEKYGLKKPNIIEYTSETGEIDWDGYRSEQMRILSDAGDMIHSYSTVLIDEAQDFSYEWFEFIDRVFISEKADYLVVADEKQNVYGKALDGKRLPRVAGIRGNWAKIKGNYRMTAGGYHLAVAFQHDFMKEKYNVDDQIQVDMLAIMEKRSYQMIGDFEPETIFSAVQSFKSEGMPISPNDICILAFSNKDVREIDKCFRNHLGNKSTQTVCETVEIYNKLRKQFAVDEKGISAIEKKKRENDLETALSEIRHLKRNAFNMNPGTIKLSTIQSFKGWEINTIVLVINENEQDNTPELIYTAITRTKGNLLILNCNNNIYHSFFLREIEGDHLI